MRYIFIMLALLLGVNARALAAEQAPISRDQISLTFAPVVKRVVPAVVNIFTRRTEKIRQSPFLNDPFFGQFFGQGMGGGLPKERVVQSLGSGVIVAGDGTIVTSYHVVKGSDKITVVLNDRRELEGHVEKIDERSDLAVLKVETKGAALPSLGLRDSDTLEVGDLVLAVGNPFGVGQTVTSGIISALARSSSDISDYQFFIQTDAAINPGNSGGALVDMQGRLIGINTAIYTRSGGYQGIGFAIPANMVAAVLKGHADKSGGILQPYLGVSVQPVTAEISDAQGLSYPHGVLVKAVEPGSPAQKAGILAGDIITAIGSGEVDDAQALNSRIVTTGIGVPVLVKLWHAGRETAVQVSFTEMPAEIPNQKVTLDEGPLSGMTVAVLTPQKAMQLHVKMDKPHLLILRGSDENAGFGLQLKAGDILFAVDGKQVHSIAELKKALSQSEGLLSLTLIRGGMVLNLSMQP